MGGKEEQGGSSSSSSWSLGLRMGEMRGGDSLERTLGRGLVRGEQLRMGEQPSTNGLWLQGRAPPACFLSADQQPFRLRRRRSSRGGGADGT